MKLSVRRRFLLTVGPALCAVSDAAEAMHGAPTEAEADRAWGDLWEAAFELRRALAAWKPQGVRLADLPPEGCLPEHLRLWLAAESLTTLPPVVPNDRLAAAVAALLSAAHRAAEESLRAGIAPPCLAARRESRGIGVAAR
jgi:hypothetical protein